MKPETEIYLHPDPMYGSVALYLRQKFVRSDGSRSIAMAEQLTMRSYGPEDEGVESPPLVRLTQADCQFLADQLDRIGIKPSKQVNEASRLAATEKHLDDMRKIVEAKLNVTLL